MHLVEVVKAVEEFLVNNGEVYISEGEIGGVVRLHNKGQYKNLTWDCLHIACDDVIVSRSDFHDISISLSSYDFLLELKYLLCSGVDPLIASVAKMIDERDRIYTNECEFILIEHVHNVTNYANVPECGIYEHIITNVAWANKAWDHLVFRNDHLVTMVFGSYEEHIDIRDPNFKSILMNSISQFRS